MTLRTTPIALACALCAVTLGPAAAAQAQAYMKIDGMPGESADPAHKDEIAVDSYSFGAELPVSASTGGAGASVGRPKFDTLQFTHRFDRASPALLLALAKGQSLKTAVLSARRPGTTADFIKITLSNVLVTSVKTAGSDDGATEAVALTYSRIQIEYFAVQRDGKVVPAGKVVWDVAANKAG